MMLVVVLACFTFWLPLDGDKSGGGERLSYCSTLLLTIFAVTLFTAEGRPHTVLEQKSWLDEFQEWCILLTFIPVVETVCVWRLENLIHDVLLDEHEPVHWDKLKKKLVHAKNKGDNFLKQWGWVHPCRATPFQKSVVDKIMRGINSCDFLENGFHAKMVDALLARAYPIAVLFTLL